MILLAAMFNYAVRSVACLPAALSSIYAVKPRDMILKRARPSGNMATLYHGASRDQARHWTSLEEALMLWSKQQAFL